jgi:hypothetical protein
MYRGNHHTRLGVLAPVFVGCDIPDPVRENEEIFLKSERGPGRRLCKLDSNTAG